MTENESEIIRLEHYCNELEEQIGRMQEQIDDLERTLDNKTADYESAEYECMEASQKLAELLDHLENHVRYYR